MTVLVFLATGYKVYERVSEIQNTGFDGDIEVELLFHVDLLPNVTIRDYLKLEVLP